MPGTTRGRLLLAAALELAGMVALVLPEILGASETTFTLFMMLAAVLMLAGAILFAVELQRLRSRPDPDGD